MKAVDLLNQQMTADKEVVYFLRKYEAHACLSHTKMYYKRMPIRYTAWIEQGGPIPFEQEHYREPYVEVAIPQHRFQQLVESEQVYEDALRGHEHANSVLQQSRADERVRDSNPAVQKAWIKYQTLLELARQ